MTVEPGQTLSHYNLIEKIGEGGMGVVWKAQDMVLGRTVAIKVLPANVAGNETRRRMFLEEARLASSVSDAHIAQVHELGREGGLDFIVMEYVEGKPLHRILHGHPLPPDKVANLGHQVAQALSRAHRKGLLHRDLKPSNILVTPDGEAKIVDFGLATLFERRDTTPASTATTESATSTEDVEPKPAGPVGTLPYMSPEQARAEALDARSDIFSLGVVLYEMTTGQRPFSGSTNVALLKEIVRARPRPPHELSPKIPLDLDRIIQKALAPAKADRYQTMDDLAVDLKRLGRDLESGSSPSFDELRDALRPGRRAWLWVFSGSLGLALVVGGAWFWFGKRSHAPDSHTILVAPMEVLGQDAGDDFIGRAFAEAIAVNLSQSKGLSVLPVPQQNSGDTKDRDEPIKSAQAAGAGRVLIGSLTRNGAAIHATVSLIDSGRNRLIWGSQGNIDGPSLASFALSLAREISTRLGTVRGRLYDNIQNMPPDPRMATSSEYVDALAALRRNDSSTAFAERLVAAFPESPLAHAWRLVILARRAHYLPPGTPERHAWDEEAAVLMRLDPSNPWVEAHRANFEVTDGLIRDSLLTLDRLLSRDDLAPGLRSSLLAARALSHSRREDYDAAFRDLHEAVALDPLNPKIYRFAAAVLTDAGRYEEALEAIKHDNALMPGSTENDLFLGRALYALGRWKESLDPFRSACNASPSQLNCAMLAMALQRNGQVEEAMLFAQKATAMRTTAVGLLYLADYWALIHERGKAMDLLKRTIDLGGVTTPVDVTFLATWKDFAELRETREFQTLMADVRKRVREH